MYSCTIGMPKQIHSSRGVELSFSRLRLEINLRYVASHIQTHYLSVFADSKHPALQRGPSFTKLTQFKIQGVCGADTASFGAQLHHSLADGKRRWLSASSSRTFRESTRPSS